MDDLLSTPQARAGPTSRLLKRASLGPGALGRPSTRTPQHSLNNSLRLLDEALGSPIAPAEEVTRMIDVTRPVDTTRMSARGEMTMLAMDVTRPVREAEQSLLAGEENPGVRATENLFEDFLATLSGGEGGAAALDSIAELEQMVGVIYSWE